MDTKKTFSCQINFSTKYTLHIPCVYKYKLKWKRWIPFRFTEIENIVFSLTQRYLLKRIREKSENWKEVRCGKCTQIIKNKIGLLHWNLTNFSALFSYQIEQTKRINTLFWVLFWSAWVKKIIEWCISKLRL